MFFTLIAVVVMTSESSTVQLSSSPNVLTEQWCGERYLSFDEIIKIPQRLSCLNISGAAPTLEYTMRKCYCQGNTMFHVRNRDDFGCFQPQEICDQRGCVYLGRAILIKKHNRRLLKFTSFNIADFDSNLPKCKYEHIGTFSKWNQENRSWQAFDVNTKIKFETLDNSRILGVSESINSDAGLLRVNISCSNITVDNSYNVSSTYTRKYIITINTKFQYSVKSSARKTPTLSSTAVSSIVTVSSTTVTHLANQSLATLSNRTADDNKIEIILLTRIIPGAVGGLLVIVLIILCIVLRCKKRKDKDYNIEENIKKADLPSTSEYADPNVMIVPNEKKKMKNDQPQYINPVLQECGGTYASLDANDQMNNEYHQLNRESQKTTDPIYFNATNTTEYHTPGTVIGLDQSSNNSEPIYHETEIENEYDENEGLDMPAYASIGQCDEKISHNPHSFIDGLQQSSHIII